MYTTTAYTTVPARKSLYAQPPPPPPPHMIPPPMMPPGMPPAMVHQPPPQAQTPRTQFPEPVRQYVQRAFAESNNIAGINRADIEAKLKQVISQAAEQNQLGVIDWDGLALPQQMLKMERESAYMIAPPGYPPLHTMSIQNTNAQSLDSPRKRKSGDLSVDSEQASLPPWRQKGNHAKSLDSRITTPSKRQKNTHESLKQAQADLDKERRMKRFQSNGKTTGNRELDPEAIILGPVVGRCRDLEKRYLRLTSAPNPDFVRPLEVLRETLELLKRKWRQDGNYIYVNDQFKSMRQDLTVQHIKNEFTVNVYENHARIALEKGDLGEYNQCQSQLRALYVEKLGGHPIEFKAYRILYFLYTANTIELSDSLAELTAAEKKEPAIKHALDSRSALALGNYHRFFKLYLETPNMGAYLVDKFVDRERLAALANICRAYKPDISLRFVTEELAFDSDGEAAKFICERRGEDFLEERDGSVRFLTAKVGAHFDNLAKEAGKMVNLRH